MASSLNSPSSSPPTSLSILIPAYLINGTTNNTATNNNNGSAASFELNNTNVALSDFEKKFEINFSQL